MAPKVTSSGNRSGRKPSKPPVVTSSKGRGNRSSVSTARVSTGSNGKPKAGGARVTNSSQRTNTGSSRPTGGSRPALPPGNRGGAVTKPSSNKPTAPRSSGGRVQPVRVRDMGKPTKPSVAGGGVRGLLPGRAPISLGGLRGGLLGVAGGMAADAVGRKAGEALGRALRPLGRAIDDRLPGVNSKDEERRRNASAAATGNNSRFAGARDREIERARNIQPKPARQASPAASSGRSSGGGAAGSSRPAPAATSTAPKPPASAPKPPSVAKVETETTDAPKPPTSEATSTKKESLKIASGRRPVGREEMIEYNMRRRKKQG